ncbi:MAG TPA: hypothetical protein VMT86_10740 [Bryobacteraceae bacterium]|nr:hypothetical protein [Bryobacteraceae bacterium]
MLGAQAYNLLNRPNFDQPVNDIANPLFGSITRLVGPHDQSPGIVCGGQRFAAFRGDEGGTALLKTFIRE